MMDVEGKKMSFNKPKLLVVVGVMADEIWTRGHKRDVRSQNSSVSERDM